MIVIFENAAILKIGKFLNMKTKFLSQDKVKIRDVPDQLFHAGCRMPDFSKNDLPDRKSGTCRIAGYLTSARK